MKLLNKLQRRLLQYPMPFLGGTSIEDLAEKYPEKIIKIPVDIFEGITDEQANKMVEGLEVKGDKKAAADQIKSLYKCFTESDCTMVEVSTKPGVQEVLNEKSLGKTWTDMLLFSHAWSKSRYKATKKWASLA